MFVFAKRNFKEIIRDPLSIIFAILLPLFLLYIFQQFKIPNDVYSIENFTPGIVIFSLSFITMFTALLVAKDRDSFFTTRLLVSPLRDIDYILGYGLSVIPIVFIQNVLFFFVGCLLGLSFSINIIYTILVSMFVSILYILLGIFIGMCTHEKSSTGVSSIVVQLVAFTSGMYFSTDMIGDSFGYICNILPFKSSLDITKGILNSNYDNMFVSFGIVILYIIIILFGCISVFRCIKKSGNR